MKFRVLVITVISIFLISCNNGSEDNTSFTEIDAPAESRNISDVTLENTTSENHMGTGKDE